jgi:hypothetical protein
MMKAVVPVLLALLLVGTTAPAGGGTSPIADCPIQVSAVANDAARPAGHAIVVACVQLPVKCNSNRDCTCSGCCGQLGEGGPRLCQPSCR